ncbi:hypothetical protein ABI_32600 [Asticcacaulis biprosthecium C19]|uniref:Uncharacterized protein n=1 Tax=Asticcacaulis biprosthecium C19 TaxID=715226 RepID=F4QPV8_9CAUL|nr:hypothetical protein ABI_32600 [Asticcacaulis biprosthecium C19]
MDAGGGEGHSSGNNKDFHDPAPDDSGHRITNSSAGQVN